MDNITFTLIDEMITALQGNYDLCHSNGAYTHIVNRYTYMVKMVDLQDKRVINLSQDDSIAYLERYEDPRAVKHTFIDNMREFIRSSAPHGKDQTVPMVRADVDDACRAAEEGRVYHWNGGQMHVKDGGKVIVYNFPLQTVTHMTLAKSWVYAQQQYGYTQKKDVNSILCAAQRVR